MILPAILIVFAVMVWLMIKNAEAPTPAQIKKMAAAGTFYPADAQTLNQNLEKYLNEAEKVALTNPLRILVAPHAGIIYSGRTAAAAYKLLMESKIEKIILVGPSHYFQFAQAAMIAGGSWETPLGNLEIDGELAKKILDPEEKIIEDASVFEKEHSLETQTIFLKKILPNVKIVPILLSVPSEELISALAYKIALNMNEKTLLVISTDLSHYPNYETANKVDLATIEGFLSGDKNRFEQTTAQTTSAKNPGVETLACGYEPLRVALKVAQLLKLDPPKLLKYENSGDVTGDKNRVVGYGAIAIEGTSIKFVTPILSDQAKKEALLIAKQTLRDFVQYKRLPGEIKVTSSELADPLGAFITLRNAGDLRGCIGEFSPAKPLYKVIQEKTVAAASADPRFNPVRVDELDKLALEISVMTPRQRIYDWKQINPETDGVVVINKNKSGTYLPQVAKETGWKLEELLTHLCREKAGLADNCYLDKATEIYTYQAQVFE